MATIGLKRSEFRKGFKQKKQRNTILILTNGDLEKIYFDTIKDKHFDSPYAIKVKKVIGDVLSLVRLAVEESKSGNAYNQIWCVFDIDNSAEEGKLYDAMSLAHREGVGFAYSNVAFETWILFHNWTRSQIGQVDMKSCKKKMNELMKELGINAKYTKNKKSYQDIVNKIMPKLFTARDNSKYSYENAVADHKRLNGNHVPPPIGDWRTTSNLHQLIDALQLTEVDSKKHT